LRNTAFEHRPARGNSADRVNGGGAFATTFLASVVEAIEMVTIVIGVGAIRGWRPTLVGAGAGFAVLVVVGGGLGIGLTAIPIRALRLLIGALLLVFGLQWYQRAVRRVAARGFAGDEEEEVDAGAAGQTRLGLDWTAFVLAFKGVLLEGLEIAFIVVTFGAAARELWLGAVGGASALVLVGGLGAAFHRSLTKVPRSVLILVVGLLLTTFGSVWAAEGLGVHWPGGDIALPVLLAFYAAAASAFVVLQRRAALGRGGQPAL
jgi:uncharacterized membrane protein